MARRWHACEKALKAVSRHLDRETMGRWWPRFPRDDVKRWVCLKIGHIPNEIAIYRDNDQQNHWVKRGTQHFQTNPYDHEYMN